MHKQSLEAFFLLDVELQDGTLNTLHLHVYSEESDENKMLEYCNYYIV